jgi:hypothetical protein
LPLPFEDAGKPEDDDIEEAASDQADERRKRDARGRMRGEKLREAHMPGQEAQLRGGRPGGRGSRE